MITMNRNKTTFWYCLFDRKEPILDEDGNDTGEQRVIYTAPTEMRANISHATGYSQTEQFGNLENYDKVLVTDDVLLEIDENSVLFVDKPPEFGADGDPLFDYTVRRVAKSLNSVSIAISKVKVSSV